MADETTRLEKVLGARTAGALARNRDLHTVGDLLEFWPRRYRTYRCDLSSLWPGEHVVVVAEVKTAATRSMKSRRGRMLNVVITDGSNDVDLAFFRSFGHDTVLLPGVRAMFAGQVSRYQGRWQLAHPDYKLLTAEEGVGAQGPSLIPVYLQVKGLQNWSLAECLRIVLDQLEQVPDPLPPAVRARRGLVDRLTALRGVHAPSDAADVDRGRHRLRYEEAFVLQAVLAQRRAWRSGVRTTPRPVREGGLLAAFERRLPFELTRGQREVGAVLAEEMSSPRPMHRLLQGEVGSGKTVVALRAMLAAVDAGGQAALLAPTEVLAAQHHRSITAMLGDLAQRGRLGGSELGTRVALLTGSQSTAARRRALRETASGDAGIVIGTHALIQDDVAFHDLALVVVDEQHRFGVEQRDVLRAKGDRPPHVLVMTATPIPRTVAMTVFGDMETSTLAELPRGRSPITTHIVPDDRPGWVQRAWERVAEEVRAGRQAYVVCPRIGDPEEVLPDRSPGAAPEPSTQGLRPTLRLVRDDDGPNLLDPEEATTDRPPAGVYAVEASLRANPALHGLRLRVLHGRLPAEEKESVMLGFAAGQIDVLISTTVVEVGVDVANATVMVIMDADRFGVSQLHQLRGRVGRGEHAGLCLLVTGSEAPTARERLDAVAASTDGFELARLDLSQRREGDVLGARQSGGVSQLHFLSLLRDEELIRTAREDAFAVVGSDADLGGYPQLAAAVGQRVDAEQAAYLERG